MGNVTRGPWWRFVLLGALTTLLTGCLSYSLAKSRGWKTDTWIVTAISKDLPKEEAWSALVDEMENQDWSFADTNPEELSLKTERRRGIAGAGDLAVQITVQLRSGTAKFRVSLKNEAGETVDKIPDPIVRMIDAVVARLGSTADASGSAKGRTASDPRGSKKKGAGTRTVRVSGGGTSASPITRSPEDELGPSLSPDGSTLLVTRYEGDRAVVVGLKPSGLGGLTVYTPDTSRNEMPAWLPSGKGFVFVTDRTGRSILVRSLVATPRAGVAFVTGGAPVGESDGFPDVSPDGSRVAFSTTTRGSDQIYTVNLDGSNLVNLTEGRDPRWSPDGTRLAFVREADGASSIYLIEASTGGGLVQVTSGDLNASDPSWSPDGSRILFVGGLSSDRPARGGDDEPGSKTEIYTIRPDGSDLQAITSSDCPIKTPKWEADGKIYFAASCESNWDIWRMDAPGAAVEAAPAPAKTKSGKDAKDPFGK